MELKSLWVVAALCLTPVTSFAEEVKLNVGGVTYHSKPGYRSATPALGVEYKENESTWIGAGVYSNSHGNASYYFAFESSNAAGFGLLYGFVSGYSKYGNALFSPIYKKGPVRVVLLPMKSAVSIQFLIPISG